MKMLAYGEDALTLWSLKNRLKEILNKLGDTSDISRCRVIYRPSFGRGRKPSFGEFDFLILSKDTLYLGESKWSESSEGKKVVMKLKPAQESRHKIFAFYVEKWFEQGERLPEWEAFVNKITTEAVEKGIGKLVRENHRLSKNLQAALGLIKGHFRVCPTIKNVLLYFHLGSQVLPEPPESFNLVDVNYSKCVCKESHFVEMEL